MADKTGEDGEILEYMEETDTETQTGQDKQEQVTEHGETESEETRKKTLTEKGLEYKKENMIKQLSQLYRQLRQQSGHIERQISDNAEQSEIVTAYKEWMTLYETIIKENAEFCMLLSTEELQQYVDTTWNDRDTFLKNFKVTFANWTQRVLPPEAQNVQQKTDNAERQSHVSSKHSRLSRASVLSSSRLKAEQERAAIEARMAAFKRRQDIELAKLKLKMQEEELDLNTELAVVDAKSRVLDDFEFLSQDKDTGSQGRQDPVISGRTGRLTGACENATVPPSNIHSRLSNPPLNASAKVFTPLVCDEISRSNIHPTITSTEQAVLSVVKHLKKHSPEIKKFSGEAIEYRKFIRQFNTRIAVNADNDDERMGFLEQFTSGEAHRIVSGFSHLPATYGYSAALKELECRYGDNQIIAQAFIKRVLEWPSIRADNAKAMDDYAILLVECENAVGCMEATQILQYPDTMKKLVAKLPFYMHDKWRNMVQQASNQGEVIQFHDLVKLVQTEARKVNDPTYGKDAINTELKRVGVGGKPQSLKFPSSGRSKGSFTTVVNTDTSHEQTIDGNKQKICIYCGHSSHSLDSCKSISALPLSERLEFVKDKKLCYGCLEPNHQRRNCAHKATCATCKFRHPTMLHDETRLSKRTKTTKPVNTDNSCSNFANGVSSLTRAGEGQCTMAIVPVNVKLKNGLKVVTTYAFLDPGSSVSFCTDTLIRQLGANGQHKSITLQTMGNPFTMKTQAVDGLQVCDLDMDNEIYLPRMYTKSSIPVSKTHIPKNEDISKWDHLRDINLPEVDTDIGLMLGNNVADAYTPFELLTGPKGSPHAARTRLGWVVWNLVRGGNAVSPDSCFSVNRAEILAVQEIDQLKRLDTLLRESINFDFPERLVDDKKEASVEDKRFVDQVNRSITLRDGHYCIRLPFKRNDIKLPDNKIQGMQRLSSLKRKLLKNPGFCKDYKDFMTNILSHGYAEEVPEESLGRCDGRVWYIPHHGVYHPRKPNKIRIVFDCAATYMGTSLNNVLLQGPDLANSLLGVLYRFRREETAVMGDIESMFFQVRVPSEDMDCLRFFWWPDGNLEEEPIVYRMKVHLFGAVSSPSCSNFALQRTAEDNRDSSNPDIVNVVKKQFYVDDCLASTPTDEQAQGLIQETTALCQKGGFHLTKWISNSHHVMESVPQNDRAKGIKELQLGHDSLPNERALGVYWFVETDSLGFKIHLPVRIPTRRGILSVVSSVYDPLGIAAPFILKAKSLLQSLCRRNIGWDDQIQGEDLKIWEVWLQEVTELENLKIRRCYKPPGFGEVADCQLHMFADASDLGYGVAAYLRQTNTLGQIETTLVTGKARVAPLKKMTIPRLELTAATTAAKLSVMLTKELEVNIDRICYWTDSMTVLRYIVNEDVRFHTFVANRVSTIHEASKADQWKYVSTKENPADCVSRGLSVKKFLQCDMWLHGPPFLSQAETEWPIPATDLKPLSVDDAEVKHTSMATTQEVYGPIDKLIEHYSDWTKLKRAVAWILVGMQNLRERLTSRRKMLQQDASNRSQSLEAKQKKIDNDLLQQAPQKVKSALLTLDQLQMAERALVRYVQCKHFGEDIQRLKDSGYVTKSSPLRKLDPEIRDGIVHVGGRLDRANIEFSRKHPVILPKESAVSRLLLQDLHKRVGHLGKNSILAALRQHYWIVGAPSIIKGIVSRCVSCRKYQGPISQQKMASLPEERLVTDEPPFSRVGVDFFGPFEVKRGRTVLKRYGVIFTCLTSRAVHLELAHSLSTDSCINAIRRFIARRGAVKYIRSDNGTNLVGAEREMREEIQNWNRQKIHNHLLREGISWEFNPPTGSHFGGVWERLIRLVRKVLYSLLREQHVKVDDESLQTLLCEVEAILNGRPLTECPNSVNDLDVLTPNHLLQLRSGELLPPGAFSSSDNYAQRRWRHVQYLADIFWKRWVREYLPLLQQRDKWHRPSRNLAIGDIVMIVDSTPRNSWALGRVIEVMPDKRGQVRIVRLKTKSTTLVRPVAKLCPLVETDSK